MAEARCGRCPSGHEKTRKHDVPSGLVPVGKHTWWRLRRLLGPAVIPGDSFLFAVAAEIYDEAAPDGTDIRCGSGAIAAWAGCSLSSVEKSLTALGRLGLVYRAVDAAGPGRGGKGRPGRVAVWDLTMRDEHEEKLAAAGYALEWREGSRKYLHASKTPVSRVPALFTEGEVRGDD